MAGTIPNCVTYDPAYAYEMAVVVQDGLRRMYEEKENCFYYLTAMNENYEQPAMPEGAEEGIIKGMYLLQEGGEAERKVQLLGSGTILREVIAGAELLKEDFGVEADIWSVTSFNELRRDGLAVERQNFLHPEAEEQDAYITSCLKGRQGPVIASTDYMKLHADQVRSFIPTDYRVLGTDGFGRSDTREKLRHFFEVDRYFVVVAALQSLAKRGEIERKVVAEAIAKYNINPEKCDPLTC
jgi:pyruvate dehydrogenase E1 component